jgi:MFS superfamily sulfate permease-like transporter
MKMENEIVAAAPEVVSTAKTYASALGSAAGLIAATTAIVHFVKGWLKTWPVPPMALVVGLLLTVVSWQAGWLTVKGIPAEGATWEMWILLLVHSFIAVVLPSMGAGTILSNPQRSVKRTEPT